VEGGERDMRGGQRWGGDGLGEDGAGFACAGLRGVAAGRGEGTERGRGGGHEGRVEDLVNFVQGAGGVIGVRRREGNKDWHRRCAPRFRRLWI